MTIAPTNMHLIDSLLEVSDAEMISFTADVDLLNADVLVSMGKLPPAAELDAVQQAFVVWQSGTWVPWHSSWLAWAAAHQDGLSRMPFSAAVEFGKFKAEFNLQLRTYKEFGGSTTLQPTEPTQTKDPEPTEDDEPWYEDIADVFAQQMMLTTLVAGAGLLAYWHLTKKT